MVEVKSGVALGARIVADGTVKVRDDSPVKAVLPGQKESGKTTGNILTPSGDKSSAGS